jgi:hypothetical protein
VGKSARARNGVSQIGLIRTGIGGFSAGILNTNGAQSVGVFSDNESDHEIESLLNLLGNFVSAVRKFSRKALKGVTYF